MSKTTKALLIDVTSKTITQFDLSSEYGSIYRAIGNGCELFCCPIEFDNGDGLYADDEILLRRHDIKGGFMLPNWNYPICNNALVVGCDEEGDTCDCKTDVNDLLNEIIFIDEEMAKDYRDKAILIPPTIISF